MAIVVAWPISAWASPEQLQRMPSRAAAELAWLAPAAARRCIGQVAAVQAAVQVWGSAAAAPWAWPWSHRHPARAAARRQAGGEHHGDEQAGQPACELHHVLYLTPKVKRR